MVSDNHKDMKKEMVRQKYNELNKYLELTEKWLENVMKKDVQGLQQTRKQLREIDKIDKTGK